MKGNEIRLRCLSEEDRDAVAEILANRSVAQTYMLPDFTSPEQVESLFRRLLTLSRGKERYVRGIYAEDALVGFLNDVGIEDSSIELGWVINPRYHNRGFATQAVELAIKELFAVGFREVIAGAFEENKASIRVMEKCGMSRLDRCEEIVYREVAHKCVYCSLKR